MNQRLDPFQLHAYVDGELAPDDVAAVERALALDPAAASEVAALRAQKEALHSRFDPLLAEPHRLSFGNARARVVTPCDKPWMPRRWMGTAVAATLILSSGIATGWLARGHVDLRNAVAQRANDAPSSGASQVAAVDARFGDFVQVAAISHAIYTPEVRHPVEVPAADEAHLVAWLSKRLDAPLLVPHLGDAGWHLLGGRLLPAQVGPLAQFMYQDGRGRRLTLAVSHVKGGATNTAPNQPGSSGQHPAVAPVAAFRIAEEDGNTIFYWMAANYAYALTGKLARAEMTDLATHVYRQLDR